MSENPDIEKRGFHRLEMYTGVFLTQGERGYLSELINVSAGGVSLRKPGAWQNDPEGQYKLYFILDQDRVLCVKAKVIHQQDELLGFEFMAGYAIQAEQLLAESRNWR